MAKAVDFSRLVEKLSPDGTPAFLATSEFWEALELAAKLARLAARRPRRVATMRDLLSITRAPVVTEFYRILDCLAAARRLGRLEVLYGR